MEESNLIIKAFPVTWIVTLLLAIILWVFVSSQWALSFVLGSATTLMMMSMMFKSTRKALMQSPEQAKKTVVFNYLLRYSFYALVLVIAGMSDKLEVIATTIGLFTFKISLYLVIWLEKKGEKNA